MTKPTARYTPQQLRAAIYQNRPNVLSGVRHTLAELLSIARTYASLQKYDVTLHALDAIARLTAKYLQLRDGDLVMPTSLDAMSGTTTFGFDPVLTEAMEGLSSLHRGAIGRGDVQLSQQIIDALEFVGIQSVDTRTLIYPPGENPTTAFIQGYIFGLVQDGAIRGLDDVTMRGVAALASIGKKLLRAQIFVTAQSTIQYMEQLAYITVVQRKPHIIGEPVRGIAEMLQVAVSEVVVGTHTIDSILDALQRIAEAELNFKPSPQDYVGLRFSLGAFLDLTQPTALANIVALAIQNLSLAIKTGDFARMDKCRKIISELIDQLWARLVAIGKVAAATESFAILYINQNISEIFKQGLWLYGLLNIRPEPIDQASGHEAWRTEQFAENLLRELSWIVGATYWRIFEAFVPPIKSPLVWDFFPTLSDIGIRALDAGVPLITDSAITALKSIALKCIETPIEGYLRSAARVAVFIARVGIVAQKTRQQQVLEISLNALREFNDRYYAKQREIQPDAEFYEADLKNELSDLSRQLRDRSWFLDEEDAMFFGRVAPEDIEAFADRLPPPKFQ